MVAVVFEARFKQATLQDVTHMAVRRTAKTEVTAPVRGKARGGGRTESRVAAGAAVQSEVEALTAERDRLASELEQALRRIAQLEGAQAEVVNRIDWVIDSLHTLNEESGSQS